MAAETAQRNPGRNVRLEIGSIDREFGVRRIVYTLSAWVFSRSRRSLACYEWLTDQSPHSTSRELKPTPPARRQMCAPSHICRRRRSSAFLCRSVRRPLSAKPRQMRSTVWRFRSEHEVQARNRSCGFESQPGPDQVSSGSHSCRQTGIALSQQITRLKRMHWRSRRARVATNACPRSGTSISLQRGWLPGPSGRSR
jgi:hypothetical protein